MSNGYRDVFVPMVLGHTEPAALEAAATIAASLGGEITALVHVTAITPPTMAWDYFPEGLYQSLNEAARARARTLVAEVEAHVRALPVPAAARLAEGPWLTSAEAAASCARFADLVVWARSEQTLPEAEAAVFAGLLLESGRPLALLPTGVRWPQTLERAMVAWAPRPEASRALHDALPLLCMAQAVQIAMVEPAAGQPDTLDVAGADIAAHLARHGVATETVTLRRHGRSTVDTLLAHAASFEAQLLVAGGYGHSRLRERVFGGVTRGLFEHARLPLFLSH